MSRSGADDDKTQLVPPSNAGDQDKTVILPDRGFGSVPPQGGPQQRGQVIGTDMQQHVRVAGQPRPPGSGLNASPFSSSQQGAAVSPAGQGETVFLVSQTGGSPADQAFDPVVGWVTVVKGKGRGQSRPVYYGQNAVGRAPNHRVPLDFGDQRMSRDVHAYIVYDEVDRKYYLRDNGQRNPIRHKGNIVLAATELKDRDEFTIGETTLMFVTLCNATFDWVADQPAVDKTP